MQESSRVSFSRCSPPRCLHVSPPRMSAPTPFNRWVLSAPSRAVFINLRKARERMGCRLNCAASPTYDDAVRAAAKVLVVTGIAVALLVAVLYVAVPPNTTPEQGSADPILFARRATSRPSARAAFFVARADVGVRARCADCGASHEPDSRCSSHCGGQPNAPLIHKLSTSLGEPGIAHR